MHKKISFFILIPVEILFVDHIKRGGKPDDAGVRLAIGRIHTCHHIKGMDIRIVPKGIEILVAGAKGLLAPLLPVWKFL
ncbi:TPA: hypothetical protein RRH17_003497 [Klebsiella pneumoniae]|nr:hypothetical protein [Klebsiella pneumoniae]